MAVTTVIVIPARNEEARIADCLGALKAQIAQDTMIVLVANNCTDRTATIARETAQSLGLKLDVFQCKLPAGAGAGTARRLGFARALMFYSDVEIIITTDADCLVAADWVSRNRSHLQNVSAVCGLVRPMQSEISVLDAIETRPAEMEGHYERLVTEFYRRARPGPLGLDGEHGCAAGASIAVRVAAYQAIGGFADLATGEDRDLIRRLKDAGHGVLHAGDVQVAASCRLDGRADDGMAQALKARVKRTDYLIDDSLPSARELIGAVKHGTLGAWPLQVAPGTRIRARDLGPEIALLEKALRAPAENTRCSVVTANNMALAAQPLH